MTATLFPGCVFAGRYRVLGPIGSGGFGAVYAAQHVVTERCVAVKTLWPHIASDPVARARFLRESRLAAQVDSEFIVGVLDAGVDETTNTPFLVMELLDGENLNARLKRKKRFSPEETIVYLAQVAAALELTHARNIVHCDLKPANLFLTRRDDGAPLVKILDFGIAKLLVPGAMEASHMLGTPVYMAPEQIMQGTVSSAVDVCALAHIAFRFLVGQTYFRLEQRSQAFLLLGAAVAEGPSESASARAQRYGATLPPRFDAWFACAANVDPNERFGSAKQSVLALAWVLGLPPPEPLASPRRRLVGALTMMGGDAPDVPDVEVPDAPIAPSERTLTETVMCTRPSVRRQRAWISRAVLFGVACAFVLFGLVSVASYAWLRLPVRERPDVIPVPEAHFSSVNASPAPSSSH